MFEKSWTKAKYPITEAFVDDIGNVLTTMIKDNEGTWKGKIDSIVDFYRKKTGDGRPDLYSTFYCALPVVKDKFNIKSISAGRHGNTYFIEESSDDNVPHNEYINDLSKVQQIKTILKNIDETSLEPKEINNLINIIKKIL